MRCDKIETSQIHRGICRNEMDGNRYELKKKTEMYVTSGRQ